MDNFDDNDHFHWLVTVTFQDGSFFEDEWHASKAKAQEIVVRCAKIDNPGKNILRVECRALGVIGD